MIRAIMLTVIISSHFALAKNPQILRCHQSGGEFFVADINQHGKDDQFGFCQFGTTAVSALDVVQFVDSQKKLIPQAFVYYINNITTCTGEIKSAKIVGTESYINFCVYKDHSMIDITTLASGITNSQNQQFNNFLDQ